MQLVVARRAAAKGYVLDLLLLSFALFTPILLTWYTEMGLLAASLYWTAEICTLGFTAIMFILALITFCALILDIHKFLVSLCSAEPITLDDQHITWAAETSPATSSTMVNLLEPPTFLGKIFIFLCLPYFVQVQWKHKHIGSMQRPLLENLSAAALYLLQGAGAVCVVTALLFIIWWIRKPRARSTGAAISASNASGLANGSPRFGADEKEKECIE
ncbi:hypothetical protein DFH06DRAFT_1239811 [Mycena polygramma]|nr:hypothetical protein DFH06DRAFT_1239811 [Mycena polygramma]